MGAASGFRPAAFANSSLPWQASQRFAISRRSVGHLDARAGLRVVGGELLRRVDRAVAGGAGRARHLRVLAEPPRVDRLLPPRHRVGVLHLVAPGAGEEGPRRDDLHLGGRLRVLLAVRLGGLGAWPARLGEPVDDGLVGRGERRELALVRAHRVARVAVGARRLAGVDRRAERGHVDRRCVVAVVAVDAGVGATGEVRVTARDGGDEKRKHQESGSHRLGSRMQWVCPSTRKGPHRKR